MGIPSPFKGPHCPPHKSPLLKLLHSSPDLPREAVEELDLELLPAASVSFADAGKVKMSSWADETDSVTSDCCRTESLESTALKTASPPDSWQWNEADQDSHPSSISGCEQVPLWEGTEEFSPAVSATTCVPLWCSVQQDGNYGMLVQPCLDEADAAEAAAYGRCEIFYCRVSPHVTGGTIIEPCTDPSLCEGVAVEPMQTLSEAEASCAPPPPPEGSYAPVWVYGPRWPFNAQPTTLSITGLPGDFTQDDIIEILDKEGFSGFYDFVYLATNADSSCPSFAIVNFACHAHGLAFAARIHGRASCGGQVSWSLPLQGLEELMEHYRDHPGNDDTVPEENRPTFFINGFPKPLLRR